MRSTDESTEGRIGPERGHRRFVAWVALALSLAATMGGWLVGSLRHEPAFLLFGGLVGSLLLFFAARRAGPQEPQVSALHTELPVTVGERAMEARKLVLAASRSDSPVVIIDTQYRVEWVNDVFTRITGCTFEEVAGSQAEAVLCSEAADPGALALLREKLRRGEWFSTEAVNHDRRGFRYWLAFEVQPIHTASGRISNLIALGRDITDRKRTEEALRESEQRVRAIIETTPECVKLVASDGTLLEMNPAGLAMVEADSAADVIGRCVYSLVVPEHRDAFRAMTEHVCRGGSGSLEFEIVGLKGARRLLETRSVPLKNPADGSLIQLGMTRDITERTRVQVEMDRAREAALEAARLKSEFLANMSHEIRTPMNGILGMTELVLETNLDPEQREYIETIKSSSDALLTIINDILDFSKIEAGKLELESIPFSPRNALRDTLKPLALQARKKGLEITCHVSSGVPHTVLGDPGRLRQVVVNLVGNAIKFTERGEVTVHAGTDTITDESIVLHITVTDTGIGIPSEKTSVIFEAFAQADGSTTRKYGGTGLGLAIVSQLVEMMGGRVWVESEVGRGSAFHFTVELALDPKGEADLPPAPIRDIAGIKVLVVDDNDTNRRLLVEMVRSWGMIPRAMNEGAAALGALVEARSLGEPFSLALLDVQMPQMDGFELAEQIQRDVRVSDTSLILLTSSGLRGDAARCRGLGIDGYLTKPVMASDLLEAIQAVLGARAAPRARRLVTRHSVREGRARLRVLLAEDNPVSRTFVLRVLEKRGHSVCAVADGRAALDALDGQPFDIALMDVQMPVLDGFETTAAIREREQGSGTHLPIIALTAHAFSGDREQCREAGMDGYVPKPFDPDTLFDEIARLVPAAASEASPRSGGEELRTVFDRDSILARVGGDFDLLSEIVTIFLEDSRKLLGEMNDAITRSDAAFLQGAAHRLKGALETLAARPAADAALRVETIGRSRSLAHAADAVSALESEIARLVPELSLVVQGSAVS